MTFRTRFAPSPTGPLHLGHAYSALLAYEMATSENGEFLLRIEDIDQTRARPDWETQIADDLTWLGLHWPEPVMRQSTRLSVYEEALDRLWDNNLLYPCICSRRDIQDALTAPQENAPRQGPDGWIYPGTCRDTAALQTTYPQHGPRPRDVTLRLNMAKACDVQGVFATPCGKALSGEFTETGYGPEQQTGPIRFSPEDMMGSVGDIVLARRDMGTSYHLSVVLDDAAQGVSHVVRGQDLFEATKIHVVLQRLLGLPTPIYHHHRLIRDQNGKRLAKRDDARAIAKYRAEGATPEDIRRMVGL